MDRHAIALLLALAAGGCANVGVPRAPVAIRQCESLAGMTVPASTIGLPTRGATVRTAERAAMVAPYQDAEESISCRHPNGAWSRVRSLRSTRPHRRSALRSTCR